MAEISNLEGDYSAYLSDMDESVLVAQQITQKGAIHAIEFLIQHGCTREIADDMLSSLRANMAAISAVAQSKGFRKLFDEPSTSTGAP